MRKDMNIMSMVRRRIADTFSATCHIPKGYLYFTFILCSFISCTSSDDEQAAEPAAIGFQANVADGNSADTRAVGDGEFLLDNVKLQQEGIGVYCWYTGTDNFTTPKPVSARAGSTQPYEMLMRNQKVSYTAGQWTYSPTKYWPVNPSEKLTFRAYAPYTDYLVTGEDGMPLLPVVVAETDYHNGTQHDPLWGTSKHEGTIDANDDATQNEVYGKLYNNYTHVMSGSLLAADNKDGIIEWYFHHGMASLMIACTIIPDPGCDWVTITEIRVEPLYTRGLLDLASPTALQTDHPEWTSTSGDMEVIFGEDDLAQASPFDIEINTDATEATGPINLLSTGLLIIPRYYPAGTPFKVTLTYLVDKDTSNPIPAQASIPITFYGNKSYKMNLTLTPETRGLEISLVQAAFTTWTLGGVGTPEVFNW